MNQLFSRKWKLRYVCNSSNTSAVTLQRMQLLPTSAFKCPMRQAKLPFSRGRTRQRPHTSIDNADNPAPSRVAAVAASSTAAIVVVASTCVDAAAPTPVVADASTLMFVAVPTTSVKVAAASTPAVAGIPTSSVVKPTSTLGVSVAAVAPTAIPDRLYSLALTAACFVLSR